MKILLLEDDIIFSELIEEYLISLNYYVERVYDLESAEECLYTNKYDLLLFDINLPNGTSLDLLNIYRMNGYLTPVIMLTSFTNIDLLEKAYEYGCNDYLKKPFELKELAARILYIEETYQITNKGLLKIKENIFLDSKRSNLIKDKQIIKIAKKEAEIIKFFVINENRVITIEELVVNIWEYTKEPSIATIRTYIKNIRKLINKNFIESVKGIGYSHSNIKLL